MDKIKSNYVESHLTDTTDLILFSIVINKSPQSISKTLSTNFNKLDLKNIRHIIIRNKLENSL